MDTITTVTTHHSNPEVLNIQNFLGMLKILKPGNSCNQRLLNTIEKTKINPQDFLKILRQIESEHEMGDLVINRDLVFILNRILFNVSFQEIEMIQACLNILNSINLRALNFQYHPLNLRLNWDDEHKPNMLIEKIEYKIIETKESFTAFNIVNKLCLPTLSLEELFLICSLYMGLKITEKQEETLNNLFYRTKMTQEEIHHLNTMGIESIVDRAEDYYLSQYYIYSKTDLFHPLENLSDIIIKLYQKRTAKTENWRNLFDTIMNLYIKGLYQNSKIKEKLIGNNIFRKKHQKTYQGFEKKWRLKLGKLLQNCLARNQQNHIVLGFPLDKFFTEEKKISFLNVRKIDDTKIQSLEIPEVGKLIILCYCGLENINILCSPINKLNYALVQQALSEKGFISKYLSRHGFQTEEIRIMLESKEDILISSQPKAQ